ncbi:MAG: HEAT repeat domain-containing protein [Bryobacteraceae bacterium]
MNTKPSFRSRVVTGIAALAAGLALQAQPPAPFPPSPAPPAPAARPSAPLRPGKSGPFILYAQSPRPAAPVAPAAPPSRLWVVPSMPVMPPMPPMEPMLSMEHLPGVSLFDDQPGFGGGFGAGFGASIGASMSGLYGRLAPLATLQMDLSGLHAPMALLFEPGQSSQSDRQREQADREREAADRAREASQRVREAAQRVRETERSYSDAYQSGSRSLDRRDYEKALKYFDKVIEGKGPRTDGALYWKAYTLGKMGRREEAQATLAMLEKGFAQSRWVNDAKALGVELRQASGQGVSPENQDDEDLKLLAINSLIQSDPERAVPLLEKLLTDPKNGLKLKERALFVLAQSRSDKSRQIVASYAKGSSSNPDLQLKAVEYLGIYGSKESRGLLNDIYSSVNDVTVKRAVLRGFMIGQDKERLFNAAKNEQNTELRHEAIRYLGSIHGEVELGQLYASETNVDNKESIIQSMFMTGQTDKLLEIAKSEKDARLRRGAIRGLSMIRREKSADILTNLYSSESDKEIKEEIIRALFRQNSAKHLVEVAKKETDPELRRECVRNLSLMKSKDATDYMVELLGK